MFPQQLMQAEETKHQTSLIRLGLTGYISQIENPDYAVTFPTAARFEDNINEQLRYFCNHVAPNLLHFI